MSATALPGPRPSLPSGAERALVAGVLLFGLLVGVGLAANLQLGVALLIGACFAPVLVFAPTTSIALFVPLVFLEAVPALNLAGKAAGALVVASWFGAVVGGKLPIREVVSANRRLFEVAIVLLVWLSSSLIWATSASDVGSDLWHWYAVVLLAVVVATSVSSPQALKVVVWAFVVGAVLSVVIGVAFGLVNTGSAFASAAEPDARLEGATGDPNFLAAALVTALVMAASLMVGARSALVRLALSGSMAVFVFGLVVSQSRGGVIAGIVMVGAAFVFFRRRRGYVLLLVVFALGIGGAALAANPQAITRFTTVDSGGSGRTDLWRVAWRIAEDHPVLGVGLNNFKDEARNYTRRPGSLTRVHNIAEDPHVVHNTYLQLFTENGIPAVVLFLLLTIMCCRSAWRAGNAFERVGRLDLEAIARGVLVGLIGMLAAAFFISAGVDKRLWILFGLGPAMDAIASRMESTDESQPTALPSPVAR